MKLSNLLRRISKDVGLSCRGLSTETPDAVPFQKCLVVSKVTRYEFEQNRHRGATASQLEQVIRSRGSDFDALLHYHRLQKDFEVQVTAALKEMGAKVHVVNRLAYSPSLISWCDVVIPCGGDGTFLLAASRIRDSRKPVIGFNSDPSRSEGRLCLPKWCSRDIRGALTEIREGRFRWLHRSRIRTTLASDEKLRSAVTGAPLDLHKPILPRSVPARYNVTDGAGGDDIATTSYGMEQDNEMWKMNKDHDMDRNNPPGMVKRVLPYLALNEVFIGENVSARVSHLQVKMDGDLRPTRTKCSGLCVCTGTGSTSWQLSINSLRSCTVQELLRLWQEKKAGESGGVEGPPPTKEEAKELAAQYNNSLIFPPDDPRLVYSVRELISADVWPSPKGLKSRGFTTNVHVKSRCVDAGLVIDGGVSFPFNDGTEATLAVYPQDSLRTVTIIRNE